MENNKTMSWGWIIFWFLVFWPVGLYSCYKKISGDKSAILKNSKNIFIISYVLIAFCVTALLMTFTEDPSMFLPAILFGAGGFCVNRVGRNMKKNGEKYKKYIALIVNQHLTQIDMIATEVGVTYDVATADLQKMIDTGYFVGAYISENSREILLAKPAIDATTQTTATQSQTRVVECKGCGANNSIKIGQTNQCEYCGTAIE